MDKLFRIVLILLLTFAAACRQPPSADKPAQSSATPAATPTASAAWPLSITAVVSPAAPQVSLDPQITTSSSGPILSWLERRGDATTLRFSTRTADGWSVPMTVASGKNWFVSDADVPSVLRRSDGVLVANWLVTTDASIEAYDLLLSYSRDNGKTWAKPFSPHRDKTMTQHGFASFFELPGNSIGLVWLDGRQQELDTTSPEGGAMSLRAATFDANWKQVADDAIDTRVCECCSTTATITAEGVLTAFRDRSDKDVRDIRVASLQGGKWAPGPIVHDDNWTIPACPVNGPALSAQGRNVAVAWFTTVNDQGHAFAAFSGDAGHTWGPPIRLDDAASLGHADIELLEDGSAVATWMEFANQQGQLHVRRLEPSGAKSAAINVAAAGTRPSGMPRIARVGEELLFAWTESTPPADGASEGTQQIKTAVARVPRTTAVR